MEDKIILVRIQCLGDPYECDADRIIVGVYDKNDPYLKDIIKPDEYPPYEVYDIHRNGKVTINKKMSTYLERYYENGGK